jgi:fused signal recognition particle receptor
MFDFFRKKTPKKDPQEAPKDASSVPADDAKASSKDSQETPKKKGFFSSLFSSKSETKAEAENQEVEESLPPLEPGPHFELETIDEIASSSESEPDDSPAEKAKIEPLLDLTPPGYEPVSSPKAETPAVTAVVTEVAAEESPAEKAQIEPLLDLTPPGYEPIASPKADATIESPTATEAEKEESTVKSAQIEPLLDLTHPDNVQITNPEAEAPIETATVIEPLLDLTPPGYEPISTHKVDTTVETVAATEPATEDSPVKRAQIEPLLDLTHPDNLKITSSEAETPTETTAVIEPLLDLTPPGYEPIASPKADTPTETPAAIEPLLDLTHPDNVRLARLEAEAHAETVASTEPLLDMSLPDSSQAQTLPETTDSLPAAEPVPDAFLPEEQPSEQEGEPAIAEYEDVVPVEGEAEAPEEPEKVKRGWFKRLKDRLSSTREKIAGRIEKVLASTRSIDESVLEDLEEILYTSDLGVATTTALLERIKTKVQRKELKDSQALKLALRDALEEMLDVPQKDLVPDYPPRVILVVGINGVGKTTTIAKLARTFTERGQKVLLAAGDTFRAAAVEQLKIWSQRLNTDFVAQATGADAAAVVYDALTAAKARKVDVVLIDTAGRLHTKVNLMEELKKIKKVAGKAIPGAPHETILILDANTGQNASRQAQTFNEAIGVDSIIVTKLDGTSKGGVVVSISYELKLPVIFIGIGESYEDLKPFDKNDFANAILGIDSDTTED